MTARWTSVVGPGGAWAQSCDMPLADAWLRVATQRARQLGVGYAGAVAATRGVWDALSNAFRALNLPPLSAPPYRAALWRWYGPLGGTYEDGLHQRLEAASGSDTAGAADSLAGGRLRAAWAALGLAPLARGALCGIQVRAALASPSGRAVYQCLEDGAACGYGGWDHGCAQLGASAQGCAPWSADSWAWWTPPGMDVGGGEIRCVVAACLPPLAWSLELGGALAVALATRGAAGVLDDARLFQLATNATAANDLGVLPDELARLALALPTRDDSPEAARQFRTIAAAIGIAAQALQAIPGIGTAVGAVLGLFAALVQIAPIATGLVGDRFGRKPPVFERACISESGDGVPRYDVPDAPGWTRGGPLPTLAAAPVAAASGGLGVAGALAAALAPRGALLTSVGSVPLAPTLAVRPVWEVPGPGLGVPNTLVPAGSAAPAPLVLWTPLQSAALAGGVGLGVWGLWRLFRASRRGR